MTFEVHPDYKCLVDDTRTTTQTGTLSRRMWGGGGGSHPFPRIDKSTTFSKGVIVLLPFRPSLISSPTAQEPVSFMGGSGTTSICSGLKPESPGVRNQG